MGLNFERTISVKRLVLVNTEKHIMPVIFMGDKPYEKNINYSFFRFCINRVLTGCGNGDTQKQQTTPKQGEKKVPEQKPVEKKWSITITDTNHNTNKLVIKNKNTNEKLVNAIKDDFKFNNVNNSKYSIGEVSIRSDEPDTIYLAPMYPHLTKWNDVLIDNLTFNTKQALKKMGKNHVIVLVVDN